jgi:hypothetical protein
MPANLPLFTTLPQYNLAAGIRTEYGVFLPPGQRVTYVRSTGVQSGDSENVAGRLVPTLAAGLAECRSGQGDIVYVLPGHTETVTSTSFANLVAGTRIIGLGDLNRDDAPTFTWSSAAATWAISVKNVYIQGLRLLMDNFNGVTAPINITASGCSLVGNYMRWSSSAALLATTAITVGSGALRTVISGNLVEGAAAGVCTNGIVLLGATTPDGTQITNNVMQAACVAASGLVNVTVAAINLLIAGNQMYNVTAASTSCVTFADAANNGILAYNNFATLNNGTASAQGALFGTASLVKAFQNFCSDQPKLSGILAPGPVT